MKIKQSILILFIVFVISVFIQGCKKEDQTRLQASWSSKDPIAIPFNIRNHQKELGNLITNPSFENGKVYYEEGNDELFDIDGWKKVGQNIKWVNIKNGDFQKDEVYNGMHSIRIERSIADETETTGEGIISDFIKVIPGNYSLKLQLKLENICPNQVRIGTKMYDAINIRVQFFDKNKIEINGDEFNAFENKKIDNTFKSLTLSNFWHIDKFGWGQVFGKTASYPYFDGDIPDQARYVKIFIGLKGTGKMWVDDVDFRYSSENFTMLERLKPYMDSAYLAYDQVMPSPKYLTKKDIVNYYNSDSALYPIIVIPSNTDLALRNAVNDFKQMLVSKIKGQKDSISPEIQIVKDIDICKIRKNQFIISVGNNKLYKDLKSFLPDSLLNEHKSAYYITQADNSKNIVFLNASESNAFRYAFYTLIQLFDSNNSTFYSANIIDYPDFNERAYLLNHFEGDLNDLQTKLQLLDHYKFNSTYFEWYGADNSNHYPCSSLDELKINDYGNYNLILDLNKIQVKQSGTSKKGSINYNKILSKGFKSIMLVGDYYQPSDGCNSGSVIFHSNKDLNENLQYDHIELLNSWYNNIQRISKLTKLEFLPPLNSLDIIDKGQGRAEIYYHDLKRNLPDDITLYWSGGTYCSKSIDYAQVQRIKHIYGFLPVLFDNSLKADEQRLYSDFVRNYYAGKIRTFSLFEPYNLEAFNGFYECSKERKILLNISNLSVLNTIRVLTAADYFWNAKSYNPDKTLWIVLNKLYGRESAINLLSFNDAYYGLKEICQKMRVNGLQYKSLRIAKNFESQLIKYFKQLENTLNNKDLLDEIEVLKTKILKDYSDLIATVK